MNIIYVVVVFLNDRLFGCLMIVCVGMLIILLYILQLVNENVGMMFIVLFFVNVVMLWLIVVMIFDVLQLSDVGKCGMNVYLLWWNMIFV